MKTRTATMNRGASPTKSGMKEAMFWTTRDGKVQCDLCHHRCIIAEGKRGFCGVRENQKGALVSLVYGNVTAEAVDPIEKKPLYHFLPGSRSLSVATRGCNFRCLHCQNCDIALVASDDPLHLERERTPEALVHMAEVYSCPSISYTYTEPTIFFEFAYETACMAAERDIKNVFVTNGYITPEALQEIQPYLDAANIDLKFFRDDLYRQVCAARLEPVLDSIRLYHELGIWIELTTLIIPDCNDDEGQLRDIAEFIAELNPCIPWHVTAFRPANRMLDGEPTPFSALRNAKRIGEESGLKYVYTGNVHDPEGSRTKCPACCSVAIERNGFGSPVSHLVDGECPRCGQAVDGVWE